MAREVIVCKWRNGQTRIDKLKKTSYNPSAVKKEVNRLLS
ncbi:hypothetical protein [Mammaliicoccus sciuri]